MTAGKDRNGRELWALDLFCGAGGVTKGLQRAGFRVTGVDIKPQPNYCGDQFFQADVSTLANPYLGGYDLVWASPPCQAHSITAARWKRAHADHIQAVRELLDRPGFHWVIENVVGAPLIRPTMLCGSMFGLSVRRHRLFETSFPLFMTPTCNHEGQGKVVTVAGHPGGTSTRDGATGRGTKEDWSRAMGIDWMTARELAQAIPPAYAEYIGNAARRQIEGDTMENLLAKASGLVKVGQSGKPNQWMIRPAEMLRKTCGVQLARMEYPAATMGLYAAEEMTGE